MAISGNTVRIEAKFRGWDGVLADPSSAITLRILDEKREEVLAVTGASIQKVSTGVYYYDYTIPASVVGVYYFEWSAVLEGSPIVGREKIVARWL